MAIPTILKGETAKPIPLALAEGYDYAGCSLHVDFCGTRSTFVDLDAGGSLELCFTAEQTAAFPLGTSKAMLSLENAAGEICFMPWAKIKVTDSPADLYDAAITIDPATLNIDELPARFNDEMVSDRINAVIRWLKRTIAASAVCILPAFGAGVNVQTAPKGEIYNDEPVVTNIVFDTSGLVTINDLAAATDAAERAANNYTDEVAKDVFAAYREELAAATNAAHSAALSRTGWSITAPGVITDWLASGATGGVRIRGSSQNLNDYTAYAYNGIVYRRGGVSEDYLFDKTADNGIVRRGELAEAVEPKADARRSNWEYYTTNGLWYARLSDDWCWERQNAPTGPIPAGAPLVDSIAHTNGAWTAQFSGRVVNYTISPASGLDADVVTVTARYSWGTFPAYSTTTLIRTNALDHAVVYTDTLAYATNAVVKMVDERCSPIPDLVNDVEDLYYDKQDVINDLDTIRAGAAAGATVTNAIISAIEYIVSPETARGAVYTGVSQDTELRDGKLILYYMPYQATGAWTLNLTLADGSATGAKPTYIQGVTQISTRYPAGAIIPLTYRNGAWYCSDYNSDANNYDRNVVTYCKAAEAIAANVLTVGTTNGYYKLAAGVTFDLDLPILFCNGAQTVGKTNGNNWYSNYNGVNLATTLAGWAGDATTRGKPVFLCGTVNDADRTFTIDAETPFSLDCIPPCICLGWYNANANASFCFLPSGLIRDDLPTKQWVDEEIRSLSLGGIWDEEMQVWWTPVMSNGSLTYQATTNVNLNVEE